MKSLILGFLISAATVAGWVTHVIWTFHQESTAKVILGAIGCFAFPIGAIHGIITWF